MDTSHDLRAHSRSLEADHFLVDAEVASGRTNNSDHPDMSDDLVEDQNHSFASNQSLGSTELLLDNESVDHHVIHGYFSDDNASDENISLGDDETPRLTFNGTGGADNSSNGAAEKHDFLTDKIQNASFPHAFADEGLAENESSSIAFEELDLNASDKNASNETWPPVNMEDFNGIRNDSESFGNFSVNESSPDKFSNMSLVDMQNESQTFSVNVSLPVNVSERVPQQDNGSLLGQSEEGLEENESSSIAFEELDLNASDKNASNETWPPVNMEDFNGIRNDSESFGNFSVNESSPDKFSNMSLVDMQNESQTFSVNVSLPVNVSERVRQQDNGSLLGQSEEGLEENESSSIAFEELDLNASDKNASNETWPPVNMEDFNGIRNDSESFGNFSVNESSPDKFSNMSLVDMQNESQTFSVNASLPVNVSEGAWQQHNGSLLGQSEEGLEENESSSIAFEELDLNASDKNASNETWPPVNMEDFNGIRNDSESFGNFSVNESSPDKFTNMSLVDMQNESQTFSVNVSLPVNVSARVRQQDNGSLLGQSEEGLEENESSSIAFEELDLNASDKNASFETVLQVNASQGPSQQDNESSMEQSDEGLEENESSSIAFDDFELNVSGQNASNETIPPADLQEVNETGNDSESFGNFSSDESVPHKSDNVSFIDLQNETETFSANGSFPVNASQGPSQQDNESSMEQSDEGLEENESSIIAFDDFELNVSGQNASNETILPADLQDVNETGNDSESFGNFSSDESVPDKSDNVSFIDLQNETETLSANGSFPVNASQGPSQQDNESSMEQSDEGLEENESSSIAFDDFELNVSGQNASNETIPPADLPEVNETGNDSESFGNFSSDESVPDKSDNVSSIDLQNETETFSANGSFSVNASQGPSQQDNESSMEQSDEGLEENESSSIAFDDFELNVSGQNASNQTIPPADPQDVNETGNDSESFGNFSSDESVPDKSDNVSFIDLQNETETFSANGSFPVNASQWPSQQDNESSMEQSDEGLEENESSSIAFDDFELNVSGQNASNETIPPADLPEVNETENDSESFGNFSSDESVPDKSDNVSFIDLQNETETFSANGSFPVNASQGPSQQDNESSMEQSDEGLEENESSSIAFDDFELNVSGQNASNETILPADLQDVNETGNDSESFGNFSSDESVPDKSDNVSFIDLQNETETFFANGSFPVNASQWPSQQDNESSMEQSDEGLEENESSSIAFDDFELNVSGQNASNETIPPADLPEVNETGNDSESFGNFSSDESVPDKSDNVSFIDLQNETETFSANGSFPVNASQGPSQQDNESSMEQSDEGLEENESNSIAFDDFELNVYGQNASNETIPPADLPEVNETGNDSESFGNFSSDESVPDKSDNVSFIDLQNETETFSANGSFPVNASQGPSQQDNESSMEQSDEGLEENESSSIAFDDFELNVSGQNASNETIPPADLQDVNETGNDSESFGNFSSDESVPDKSDNVSFIVLQNETETFSANGSFPVNASQWPSQQDNESSMEQSDEGLEENESSSIAFDDFELNVSGQNASNETIPPANLPEVNETGNDSESFGNFSSDESVPDKSDNVSFIDLQNETETLSANGSFPVNASQGPSQQDNESSMEQSDEGLEENESSSIAFDDFELNVSGQNASNETIPPADLPEVNETGNDSESFGNFSSDESVPDKSDNVSFIDLQNETETFSSNGSFPVNASQGPSQQDNESSMEQSDEGLEENESSSIAFDDFELNVSGQNASNETIPPADLPEVNETGNDSESFGNFSSDESVPDKSDNVSFIDLQNETETFSANGSFPVNASQWPSQQDNESSMAQSDEGLEENESSSIAFDDFELNVSEKNASNETEAWWWGQAFLVLRRFDTV